MTTETVQSDRILNYAFLLGGITALVFGIVLLIRQEEALSLLMIMLGLWWMIQGAFMIFAVFVDNEDAFWKLAIGVLGLVAGFLVLTNPAEATGFFKGFLGAFMGIVGILVGLSALIGMFRGAGFGAGLFGLISLVMGVIILFNAQFTTELLIYLFGILLLIDGVGGIYLALRYK